MEIGRQRDSESLEGLWHAEEWSDVQASDGVGEA